MSIKLSTLRNAQSTTISFLRLPREVRELFYFALLRPDCKLRTSGYYNSSKSIADSCEDSYHGCTNNLAACSLNYEEGVEVLHAHENEILIDHSPRKIFQHQRNHPFPGHLGWTFDDDEYTARSFTELQFLRFRHVNIVIQYPGSPWMLKLRSRNSASRLTS